MFCTNCGKENKSSNQFCSACGKPLKDMKKAKVQEQAWFVILLLLIFWPAGFFLMWKHEKFNKPARVILSLIPCVYAAAVLILLALSSDPMDAGMGTDNISKFAGQFAEQSVKKDGYDNPDDDAVFAYNPADMQFIQWANDRLDGAYVIDEARLTKEDEISYYTITDNQGEEGLVALCHDNEDSTDQVVETIIVGFKNSINSSVDVVCMLGAGIDANFSYENAYKVVMNDNTYTAGDMTVFKAAFENLIEVAALAPTEYILTEQ